MRRNIALAAAAALVASLVAVSAIPAAASTPSTTCQTGDGPYCVLVIAAPSSVRTGSAFTVQVLITTDGTVIAKSDPCGSKVAVTLEVSGEPLDEPLSFTALASAGIAADSRRAPAMSPRATRLRTCSSRALS